MLNHIKKIADELCPLKHFRIALWKNISDILPARKSGQRNSIRLTNQASNDTIPEHECADYINSFFSYRKI